MPSLYKLLSVSFCPLLLTACGDFLFGESLDGEASDVASPVCVPPSDVVSVFSNNCALGGCHDAGTAISELDLETDPYRATVGVPSSTYSGELVTPGDASVSVLWLKMSGDSNFGLVMPTTGQLDDASVDLIGAWIDDGAVGEGCAEDTAQE